MSVIIKSKVLKARKEHHCYFCGGRISKGERYNKSINKNLDGQLFIWKSHIHCGELCDKIWDYVDPYDGMTSDDFSDAVRELADTFYCPYHCEKYNNNNKDCDEFFDNDTCVRKFAEFMKTRKLKLVNDPNLGMCWRIVKKGSEVKG